MPHLIVKDATQERSPVQFIHHQPSQMSPQQHENAFEVVDVEKAPKVKPYQIARLFANANTKEHWWEVERKPKLTKYEFWSAIPRMFRIDLMKEYVVDNDDLADALFMLDMQDEVDMESDEVKIILDTLKEFCDFTL